MKYVKDGLGPDRADRSPDRLLADPPASYRIHPFWFWNGDLDDDELRWQIRQMARQGVGGFFICARQGLDVPYLSDEWFRKVRVALEEAKSCGLDVWLYDEYPYPSGIAGGEVTLYHPEAKHYTLEHRSFRVEGGALCEEVLPWGRILSIKAVPISEQKGKRDWERAVDIVSYVGSWQAEPVFQKTGLTAYNRKRFFTYDTVWKLHWRAPSGEEAWEIHAFLEQEVSSFKYYGTFVDPCNEQAVRTFIERTHERYAREIGEYFGDPIKGIFTDETGYLGKIPWTPELKSYFFDKYGLDLAEQLPQIVLGQGGNTAMMRYRYFQALHELLRERYHKPIRDWCDRHGLAYVAEVPAMRMTTQLYSHYPGGDSAHEKLGRPLRWILDTYMLSFRSNCKMVSSLAHQLGSKRALIECFHSVGWSMTLKDARWMIDRMAAMGINFFNFHAFFYTLDGLTKHDAPPSHFFQNPYWEHFHLLGDYAGRISQLMSGAKSEARIAVLDPTTSLWTHMGNPMHAFSYCGQSEEEQKRLEKLKRDWADICQMLTLHRFEYDHLDAEMLAKADVSDGNIRIGNAQYSLLVLPPLTNIERAAWEQIKAFAANGGTVIAYALLPFESIEEEGPSVEELRQWFGLDPGETKNAGEKVVRGVNRCFFVPAASGLTSLLKLIDEHAPRSVVLEVDGAQSFLMHVRRTPEENVLVFVTNQEGDAHQTKLVIHADRLWNHGFGAPLQSSNAQDQLCLTRIDLETGERRRLQAERTDTGWILPLYFAPYASHLIELRKSAEECAASADRIGEDDLWEIDASGIWQVEPVRDNVVRFDRFDLYIADQLVKKNVEAKTFIDQCADMETAPPARYTQVFGTPMKMAPAYPIECRYETSFIVHDVPRSCRLMMDESTISGSYTIFINGKALPREGWAAERWYDHKNRLCEIGSLLKKGVNRLSIQVRLERDGDGVVDALYLTGAFKVTHDELQRPILAKPVREVSLRIAPFVDGPLAGFPYYAGSLVFKRNEYLDQMPTTPYFTLRFSGWDRHFHDCAVVKVNGRSLGVRAWTPYEWRGKTEWLRKGQNDVEIVVINSLIGLLEGKYFDYEKHELIEVHGRSFI